LHNTAEDDVVVILLGSISACICVFAATAFHYMPALFELSG